LERRWTAARTTVERLVLAPPDSSLIDDDTILRPNTSLQVPKMVRFVSMDDSPMLRQQVVRPILQITNSPPVTGAISRRVFDVWGWWVCSWGRWRTRGPPGKTAPQPYKGQRNATGAVPFHQGLPVGGGVGALPCPGWWWPECIDASVRSCVRVCAETPLPQAWRGSRPSPPHWRPLTPAPSTPQRPPRLNTTLPYGAAPVMAMDPLPCAHPHPVLYRPVPSV